MKKNKNIKKTLCLLREKYLLVVDFSNKLLSPVLLIIIRFWMAKIFWYSGLTKITSWNSTVDLFTYEYKVPILNPEIAAYCATIFELTCPVLLVLGLVTRFATLPMLAMTVVIQFTYLNLIEHIYWIILLCTILFYGPGKLSMDYFINFLITRKCDRLSKAR